MALKAGDNAPDFKTTDQDGKPLRLSDFKGKKVVLYFYPRDMTPGCTAEACNLRDNYKVLQKRGYEVFGVSTDSEKSHQKFIAKEKLPFSLLADVDKSIHNKYGTWVEKSLYGRTYMGTARKTFVINEKGTIDEIIEKVDTKDHSAQILKRNNEIARAEPATKSTRMKSVKRSAPSAKKVRKTTLKKKGRKK
jgi:thioredoxin-dependent peroxiredoxin